jgi:lysophospholipase L1-like esterase
VAPALWRVVRGYRRFTARIVGTRTWQTTPHRFQAALRQLIRAIRYESHALVLVLDLEPPGDMLEHFLPGMEARHRVVQEQLREAVASFGDAEVRLVRVSEAIGMEGPDAMPDEMHYSPLGHRVVGELLAAEVHEWMSEGREP